MLLSEGGTSSSKAPRIGKETEIVTCLIPLKFLIILTLLWKDLDVDTFWLESGV